MLLKQRMKYRLIKEYPTSPTLDTIVYYYNERFWYQDNDKPFEFTNDVILHYPEYWQPESEWVSKLTNSPIGSLHWFFTLMGWISTPEQWTQFKERDTDFKLLISWLEDSRKARLEIEDYFKDKLK